MAMAEQSIECLTLFAFSSENWGRPSEEVGALMDTPALSQSELQRYARHIVLPEIGGPGQQALKKARVLVIGAGGLGSPVLQYLAAAGVGTLGIVDDDTVSLSNLQRQIIHTTNSVGRPKTESAGDAITGLNPHGCRIRSRTTVDILLIVGIEDAFTVFPLNRS